jgi:hypothetical protein
MVAQTIRGNTGNLLGCELPCIEIRGTCKECIDSDELFDNELFGMSGCGSCTASTTYSETLSAWDGVLRPYIPVVTGVPNAWDGCTYAATRNGSKYKPAIINGKKLASATLVISSGVILTISCDSETIWQGTQDSPSFDDDDFLKPIKRSGGCSTNIEYLHLRKVSSHGCCGEGYDGEGCPSDAACASANTDKCWQFKHTGFTGSSCLHLNTDRYVADSFNQVKDTSISCTWATTVNPTYSPQASIRCAELGHEYAEWVYSDGAPNPLYGSLGPVEDPGFAPDNYFPPKPANWTEFEVFGTCLCAGQSVTAHYKYGDCA